VNLSKWNTEELSTTFDRTHADQIASAAIRTREKAADAGEHEGVSPINFSRFTVLEMEGRTHVDTATAAYHLGRKPQTLRVWATYENGPIRPIRVYGRLAWPVAEIRRILSA